ncbi:anoctamin-7-like [Mauremys reevesii]|uniref:anoctamin-7-like n=1 Tax=Mauremys reevesii TaxID=260615 RepID=UPI00193FAF80|nr:anoctamin-7-like [Mauremys reevesii]
MAPPPLVVLSSGAGVGSVRFTSCGSSHVPELMGNYFRDGQTKIDFVLVWEEKVRPPKKRRGKLAAHEARGDRPRGHHEHWRRKFLNNLRNAGLLMEKEEMLSERKTIHYLKLSAPWDVLVFYAEELCLRAPLQYSRKVTAQKDMKTLKKTVPG